MSKLVSVIIPCFNAARWLAETIDSCLQQTYPNIEIIVIDDGSTDNSLEILKSYGDKIIWENCSHQGGNHARNFGFALSKGEYIQFLDADDYILPEKIERQVRFLETTGVDVVYGDWRYKHHLPDGTSYLDKIEIPGEQADIIESLLVDWWTALASLLYRRTAVEKSGGWDEELAAAQDRDFFLSVVINGAKVLYQPGCYSVYRRYGYVTVSSSSPNRWIQNHSIVLKKAENKLLKLNKLYDKYRYAIAQCYLNMSRVALKHNYFKLYFKLIEEVLITYPDFKKKSRKAIYVFLQNICGFRQSERLVFSFICTRKIVRFTIKPFAQIKKIVQVSS
ncbi:glycosyl transferase family 2 [Fischerella thermalis CCMEE 5268]|uniref:Glycosyl transferase family 2 n=1 Tax=Fischerella thermalis CCMEE 5268 TaxID=2019662 RepID=A0A2N6KE54_9CYAN|nr:glycosyltransferase [Fischerella thermalis]PLZ97231.1 glycosyl transferase family 2 [Fischerella thermalis CCMEE 5268]